jgi:hypothetical protein
MFLVNDCNQSPLVKATKKEIIGIVKVLLEHMSTAHLLLKVFCSLFIDAFPAERLDIRKVLTGW